MDKLIGQLVSVALAGRQPTLNFIYLIVAETACYLLVRRLGR